MEKTQLQHFYQRLIDFRQDEINKAARIKEGLRNSFQDSVGEISLYDNHPGDIGDVTFERGKDVGQKLFIEDRLAMIQEALDSIKKGTYGKCASCGKQIEEERLEAIPYTTLCRQCKSSLEDRESHIRPTEEEVVSLPFGEKTSGNNAFDGEDAWQAVARYGTSNSPADIGSVDDYDDVYVNAYEDIGSVEDYETIPVTKGEDGQYYKDYTAYDDQ